MLPQKFIILFLFIILSHFAEGQLSHSRHFSNGGFPCNRNILLDSLGYFFKEEGCEGRSRISFGKYTIKQGNIVAFKFLPLDSIKPIKQIKYYDTKKDTLFTIAFYDRDGNPLGYNFNIKFISSTGQVVEDAPFTELDGRMTIKPNQFKEILLNDLLPTFKVQPVKIGNQSMEIWFNLPRMFLGYNEVREGKPEKLQLLMTDEGLMSVDRKQMMYASSN